MKRTILLAALSLFAAQSAMSKDVISTGAKNIIKVEVQPGGELVRFKYCEGKKFTKCELLGEGLYKLEDIQDFKVEQRIKLALNGLGAVASLPTAGFFIIYGATFTTTGIGAIVGIPMMGAGTILGYGGVKLGGYFSDNSDNLFYLSDEIISDKPVLRRDFNIMEELKKLSKEPNTFENRTKIKELQQRENEVTYNSVRYMANTIDHALLRLNPAVIER